jgi:hypothetical protein
MIFVLSANTAKLAQGWQATRRPVPRSSKRTSRMSQVELNFSAVFQESRLNQDCSRLNKSLQLQARVLCRPAAMVEPLDMRLELVVLKLL